MGLGSSLSPSLSPYSQLSWEWWRVGVKIRSLYSGVGIRTEHGQGLHHVFCLFSSLSNLRAV